MPTQPPGTVIDGRYVLGELLGAGASGAVFAAQDRERTHEPDVALKVLRPELADDDGLRARFRREAGVLQRLTHPAIVAVLGQGEAHFDGSEQRLPYLVMERLRGSTLRSALEGGPQARGDVAAWLAPVASALDLAHEAGVLHGDLKPDNLFLASGGPRLVDFGSAKVHGFPRLTATGELAGTPIYMAPEVISGDRALDARTDVYALGVTVYEALTGRLPFAARHPGRLVAAIMGGAPRPLVEQDETLTGLDPILARALHRDANERFESAGAFARAMAAP